MKKAAQMGMVARFRVDAAMLRAIERAAVDDDRTQADWLRAVIKRELRGRGLLKTESLIGQRRG